MLKEESSENPTVVLVEEEESERPTGVLETPAEQPVASALEEEQSEQPTGSLVSAEGVAQQDESTFRFTMKVDEIVVHTEEEC